MRNIPEDRLQSLKRVQHLMSRKALEEEKVRTHLLLLSPIVLSELLPGPAFLPSEHNELPPGVAFMVRGPLYHRPILY
jgi:hypothetical protein